MELLGRWREGDAPAANALFERYFDRLFRFFATKVDRGVEDLVQETFLACVNTRDRLTPAASFRGLVFGIARRLLYKKWRDENHGAKAIDFGLTSVADLGPTPSALAAQREEQRQLLRSLQQLPAELQIALELFYWENMSSAEIGEVLDLKAGTVRSRLRRARELLRTEMSRGGAAVDDAPDFAGLARSVGRVAVEKSTPR